MTFLLTFYNIGFTSSVSTQSSYLPRLPPTKSYSVNHFLSWRIPQHLCTSSYFFLSVSEGLKANVISYQIDQQLSWTSLLTCENFLVLRYKLRQMSTQQCISPQGMPLVSTGLSDSPRTIYCKVLGIVPFITLQNPSPLPPPTQGTITFQPSGRGKQPFFEPLYTQLLSLPLYVQILQFHASTFFQRTWVLGIYGCSSSFHVSHNLSYFII